MSYATTFGSLPVFIPPEVDNSNMSRSGRGRGGGDGDEEDRFGDALAALAVEDAPDIDPVRAVRETRES